MRLSENISRNLTYKNSEKKIQNYQKLIFFAVDSSKGCAWSMTRFFYELRLRIPCFNFFQKCHQNNLQKMFQKSAFKLLLVPLVSQESCHKSSKNSAQEIRKNLFPQYGFQKLLIFAGMCEERSLKNAMDISIIITFWC